MRVLISGARGLLGGALCRVGARLGHACLPLERALVDWREPTRNADLFDQADGLIHAACNTDVEQCEREPQACYRDNTLLTELVARAAAQAGKRFIYISSTGVYGTHKPDPYYEYDDCLPLTHHHRSKLLAERVVLRHCPDALIIRTGWLFGGEPANRKNFVMRRIEEAQALQGGAMYSNAEQFGNPSFVDDVARRLYLLLGQGESGIFNCVGQGVASRRDYVSAIIELAGLANPILAAPASHFKRIAPVSNNEAAYNWRAEAAGHGPMPDWRASLAGYLRDELGLAR